MLQAPAVAGSEQPSPSLNGLGTALADRATSEYHVVRMNEDGKNAILIAARTTLFKGVELLCDRNFKERDKKQTRLLICKATLKKPVANIGETIVIAGFHGNNETMKRTYPSDAEYVWRETARLLKYHQVDLFAGDFNMWMLQVPNTLRQFGITCDTIAYYPFELGPAVADPRFVCRVGLDSMAMFWLGGNVEAMVNWPYNHIDRLKDAGRIGRIKSDFGEWLDTYEGAGTYPGFHWARYRATDRKVEPDTAKNFEKSMTEFLSHSTTVEDWAAKFKTDGARSWLRLKQKKCEPEYFHVGGQYFGGTHLPLRVFTEGASARSKESKQKAVNRKSAVATSQAQNAWFAHDKGKGRQGQGQGWQASNRAGNGKGNGKPVGAPSNQHRPHQWHANSWKY